MLVLAAAGSTGAQTQPAAQGMSTGIDVQQFKPMPGAADVLGVLSLGNFRVVLRAKPEAPPVPAGAAAKTRRKSAKK